MSHDKLVLISKGWLDRLEAAANTVVGSGGARHAELCPISGAYEDVDCTCGLTELRDALPEDGAALGEVPE